MELLDLISRCKGGEMSVFLAMLAAHAMGADTVSPSWLMARAGMADKTVAKNLHRLKDWHLVEQVTTKQWRLSAAGIALDIPRISENLRLEAAQSVDKSVDNPVDNSLGYVVDAVSLRRKFYENGREVVSSTTSLCSGGSREINRNLINDQPQPHKQSRKFYDFSEEHRIEAERLARMLTARIVGNWRAFAVALAGQLEAGTSAEVLELDVLLWSAFIRHGRSGTVRNAASFVMSMIRDDQRAPRTERETLAGAGPGWGEQHPDLARVDELIGLVDQETQE